jgi:hypothetical protein
VDVPPKDPMTPDPLPPIFPARRPSPGAGPVWMLLFSGIVLAVIAASTDHVVGRSVGVAMAGVVFIAFGVMVERYGT